MMRIKAFLAMGVAFVLAQIFAFPALAKEGAGASSDGGARTSAVSASTDRAKASDNAKTAPKKELSSKNSSEKTLKENKAHKKKDKRNLTRSVKNIKAALSDADIIEASKPFKDISPFEADSDFKPVCLIDEIVFAHLKERGLTPAKLCSDAVFVRRAFLDLTGKIPSPSKAKSFIDDKSPDKREKLVNELLGSSEFCSYFSMLFCDFLRVKAEFPINLWPNAAQAYHRFIYKSLEDNIGYDEMTKRILTSEGSNFRIGEVNFFRAMQGKNAEGIASCVALSFMGIRYEGLSETKKNELAAFFSRVSYKSTKEWKEEIVFDDPSKRKPFLGVFPDGTTVALSAEDNPRKAFSDWLCKRGNPYFARAAANRIWNWLFGVPVVSPVDDMFASNPPVSQKLLDELASELEKSDFNLRAFCKTILMSRTYQQSSIPTCDPEKARENFGVYGVRQLGAEQLIDAVCSVSGTSESYGSTTPEPYTTMPDDASAVSIPDGSITSSFLELFGKPPRDTGLDAERVVSPSTSQRLHMINSTHVRKKIESGPALRQIYRLGGQKAFESLSLAILSRYPTYDERLAFRDYVPMKDNKNSWLKLVDSAWAMLNSEEFLNRH